MALSSIKEREFPLLRKILTKDMPVLSLVEPEVRFLSGRMNGMEMEMKNGMKENLTQMIMAMESGIQENGLKN